MVACTPDQAGHSGHSGHSGQATGDPATRSTTRAGTRLGPGGELTTLLRLRFDDAQLRDGRLLARNDGVARVETSVASYGDGAVRLVDGPEGSALRFPAATGDPATPPRAVLSITPAPGGDADVLSPGTRVFSFGASFRLDAVSTGGDDNGDNLMQRGLIGSASQYKIQVDHDRPSCRVAGSEGEALVRSPVTVRTGRWYTVRCTREEDEVTLQVTEHGSDTTHEASVAGRTGSLDAPGDLPLSVGGKLTAQGAAVRSNSDQFNGEVDDVVLLVR